LIGMLHKVKQWLGPLWWYTIILFCVQRLGDVVNMVIGLYLVPKYVPQQELGAVLPLTKVGALLVLPLGILILPFKKFLNTYATNGEYGKIKRLLLDMFVLSALLAAGALVYARFFMPFVFERMRVVDGRLGLLIVVSGVVGALAPVFSSTLEALKRFRLIAVTGLFSAPLRLVTLLVVMPIRGLSGYFVGQIVPDLFGMGVALWRLAHLLGAKVKSVPYFKADGAAMFRYLVPIAVFSVAGMVVTVVEAFVIRHRLPDVESAAYYMISRFAEIGNYLGNTVICVLFPLVAERHERGKDSSRMLNQSLGVILGGGTLLSLGFYLGGRYLLSAVATWSIYAAFVPQMVLLSVILCFRSAAWCYMTYEMASNRFAYIYYCSGLYLVEVVFLYGVTGYTFFKPYVPGSWMDWVSSLNPGRLNFILQTICVFSVLNVIGIVARRSDLGKFWKTGAKLFHLPTRLRNSKIPHP
jgi:O-antigen/teichoic acid export membrane protein